MLPPRLDAKNWLLLDEKLIFSEIDTTPFALSQFTLLCPIKFVPSIIPGSFRSHHAAHPNLQSVPSIFLSCHARSTHLFLFLFTQDLGFFPPVRDSLTRKYARITPILRLLSAVWCHPCQLFGAIHVMLTAFLSCDIILQNPISPGAKSWADPYVPNSLGTTRSR